MQDSPPLLLSTLSTLMICLNWRLETLWEFEKKICYSGCVWEMKI